MAWEKRWGRLYLYRTVRRGSRFIKEYYGRGPAADLAAQMMAERRHARAAEAEALRTLKGALAPADRLAADLDAACRSLTETTLMAAGYYKHHYQWRPRHGRAATPTDR